MLHPKEFEQLLAAINGMGCKFSGYDSYYIRSAHMINLLKTYVGTEKEKMVTQLSAEREIDLD